MKDTELAPAAPADVMPSDFALANLTPEQIDRAVEAVDRVAEARQKMIRVCLKRAQADDFIDFDGKPYLEGEGADRIAAVVGIQFSAPEFEEERKGDDIFVDVLLQATWPMTQACITELGSCSTRDKFFAGRDGSSGTMRKMLEYCNGDRELAAKMLSGHVRKKAFANAKGRAVCALLGIKGLSWDTLAELGFGREKAGAKVTYAKGSATTQRKGEAGKFVPLWEAAELPNKSVANTAGTISRVIQEKTSTDKDVFRVWLEATDRASGQKAEIKATLWGIGPDWAVPDCKVLVTKLRVGEYAGNPQYTIDEWEPYENGEGGE